MCTLSGLRQLQDEVPQEMLQNIMLATSRHATEQELLSASLLPFDKVSPRGIRSRRCITQQIITRGLGDDRCLHHMGCASRVPPCGNWDVGWLFCRSWKWLVA